MPLPETMTLPEFDLAKQKILIYGAEGVGKSEFASKFPNVLFLDSDDGLKRLSVFRSPICSWRDIQQAYDDLVIDHARFQTVCIDTIDLVSLFCEDDICATHKVDAINDGALGYGKGIALTRNKMRTFLLRLAALQMGVVLVSHSRSKEIDVRTGKYMKIVPALPDRMSTELILPMMDMVLYMEMTSELDKEGNVIKDKRVIHTGSNKFYAAKDRTGRLPEELPLDYDAFLAAYNRQSQPLLKGGK